MLPFAVASTFDGILMRPTLFCALLAVAAGHAAAADDAVLELAKASGCTSCHAPHEKIVGPAFSAVAAKYAGDKDALATLMQSIKGGSTGKWGRAAMPAHASLSADDAKALATWVLATK